MLSYKLFKEIVKDKFKEYLPEEYQNCKLIFRQVEKVNGTMDGIILVGETRVAPCMYINHLYEEYRDNEKVDTILRKAAVSMVEGLKKGPDLNSFNYESAKDNIYMKLINTSKNQPILENCPHRKFNDLSIVYYVAVRIGDDMGCTVISNNMMKLYGVTEKELYMLATQNVERKMPTTIDDIRDIEQMFMAGLGLEDEMMGENAPEMYVVSKQGGINGAIAMMDKEALQTLSERLGGNLHVLPSSVHEVIVIRAEEEHEHELENMVKHINETEVPVEDRLSDHIYYYNSSTRLLTTVVSPFEINYGDEEQRKDENYMRESISFSGR